MASRDASSDEVLYRRHRDPTATPIGVRRQFTRIQMLIQSRSADRKQLAGARRCYDKFIFAKAGATNGHCTSRSEYIERVGLLSKYASSQFVQFRGENYFVANSLANFLGRPGVTLSPAFRL
jgi:hypothetical protein